MQEAPIVELLAGTYVEVLLVGPGVHSVATDVFDLHPKTQDDTPVEPRLLKIDARLPSGLSRDCFLSSFVNIHLTSAPSPGLNSHDLCQILYQFARPFAMLSPVQQILLGWSECSPPYVYRESCGLYLRLSLSLRNIDGIFPLAQLIPVLT